MKFYTDIIALCGRFFGIKDATEAEVHQALQEAKTYEELKADAIAEAGVTLDKLNEVSAKLESMTTEMEAIKADNTGQAEKIEAWEAKTKELTEAVEQKDKVIAGHVEQIGVLSKELAGFRVEKPAADTPKVAVPAAENIPVQQAAKSTARQIVSNEQFAEIFNN